ncbi:50S ribosomal protein L18 [Candidatus Roizmanbacteria bacterium RIFCSPHIGHO2_01_FULL_39_12c]|uniref:Large ribosomal subunit protein uL18 n=1 Tax=Candidatus Roizmanbacteria bacterium RIFCSPHIGHO2_01_FULL_39_12c TaxID=1802031 RepID=A0A1F7GE72_9BACT|nr:MAG: 50S ribosomal protein L18 [Candidatus Roizmanbacteria bacterium RIFCSPHIGHO2_01_FULL_39_12c]OGK47576.1 MAG: 50S ribosomal protein L18 [Candidatus Roizmanbacteria bacterium RIFCSPLOWO2_01_FULL_40_13]
MNKNIKDRRSRRKKRVSSKISGSKDKPRISVFASKLYTYAQAIDDIARETLTEYSSLKMARDKDYKKDKKVSEAKKVGIELARKIKKIGVKQAVFDRGRYSYNGRVKAVADGLREEGIQI